MGLLLLVVGLVAGLYSPWVQDNLSHAVVAYLNAKEGNTTEISLSRLRLRFPFKLDISGISMVDTETKDTIMSATGAIADLKLLPLLKGEVGLESIRLIDARYSMGAPDSALFMNVHIGKLDIAPSVITLGKTMSVDLSDATVANGVVDIAINPYAPSTPAAPADSTATMPVIRAKRLELVNFTYTMTLPPTIDSLGATLHHAVLSDAAIDLGAQTVRVDSLAAILRATYLVPDSAEAAPVDTAASASVPWDIRLRQVTFTGSRAIYAVRGYNPLPGFDPSYIDVDSISLRVKDFWNRATDLSIPITTLAGTERCGVRLYADGLFSLDSAAMHISGMHISTLQTTLLNVSATMGLGEMATDPSLPLYLSLDGHVDPEDLAKMFPFATPIMAGLGYGNPIMLDVDALGTAGELGLRKMSVEVNRCVTLNADGRIFSPFDPDRLGADVNLHGSIINITPLKYKLFDRAVAQMFNIPPTRLDGHVAMRDGNIDGRLRAVTRKGSLALNGSWKGRPEAYDADLKLKDFPLDAFLPTIPVGNITASLSAKGRGLDIESSSMTTNVDAEVESVEYDGYTYTGIGLEASVADGNGDVRLSGHNDDLDLDITVKGNLAGDTYVWDVDIEAPKVDMKGLHFSPSILDIEATANIKAEYTPADSLINVDFHLLDMSVRDSLKVMDFYDITARLHGTSSSTTLQINNRDLTANFFSPTVPMAFVDGASLAADSVMQKLSTGHFDVELLQRNLPPFEFILNGGGDNFITDFLHPSGMTLRHVDLTAANDSIFSLRTQVLEFMTSEQRVDTISFNAVQDSTRLILSGGIHNRPGTFDNFANIVLNGFISSDELQMRVTQKNIKSVTGFDIGLRAFYTEGDSTVTVSFFPLDPVIAYKPWTLNKDNYVSYNFPYRHVDANLHLLTAQSSIELYTAHDVAHDHDHEGTPEQEDVIVKINNLRISDWLSFNPFAPPVKGSVDADMRLRWSDTSLYGQGSVSLDSLYYGKERVGDFRADIDVTTGADGLIRAKADLMVDGARTITLNGALNDSTATSPFNLDFAMIHFPLSTVNPFLPSGTAKMRGTLNGKMEITGDQTHPVFNGALDFDSAAVKIIMLGAEYPFSENPIKMKDNVVTFEDFTIMGVNKSPLKLSGKVDISNLDNAGIDLTAKARNMGLVNTSRAPKGADIFGKAFIDLDADVKGNMRYLDINAALTVLAGTNITYTTVTAESALQSHDTGDLVKFIEFNDTTAVALDTVPEGTLAMSVDAVLTVETGTTINVNLGTDGKVKIVPNGMLNYTQAPLADGRLTGRLNIPEGFVKYSVLFLGEKQFDFRDGSYINFSGDMMNPSLNIQAYDRIKASVTQEGQNSHLVNFDVGLSVTGTLNTMNVAFDLTTNDDLSIANELQSMTPEQRANQAMSLLLYNTYTGPGTKTNTNSNLGESAIYSFLESQLNSWAAQNIKGVDLSFGIDQYGQTYDGSSSTTTQYSYKVSKALFNDRFKIIVGGNYSTDANNDENFSQNLINDISFEYLLNRQGTMYVRLFRHTGYESILEGEVTQTGVGFVYKRKIRTFLDMFRPFRRYDSLPTPVQLPTEVPAPVATVNSTTSTSGRNDE